MRLGKAVAGIAKEIKAASVGLVVPTGTSNAGLNQLFMGIHDSFYADNRYKKVPEGGFPANKLSKLGLLGCSTSVTSDIALTYKLSEMMASGVKFARDLVGESNLFKIIDIFFILFVCKFLKQGHHQILKLQ